MKHKKMQNVWLKDEEIKKLIEVASKTREYAFCHRSNHKIGASVLTRDGQIYVDKLSQALPAGYRTKNNLEALYSYNGHKKKKDNKKKK